MRGQHPHGVEQEQGPRLRRDVAGRVVQAEVRLEPLAGVHALGDDVAAPVLAELVDHDPVVAADPADLLDDQLPQLAHPARRLEPRQAALEQLVEVGPRRRRRLWHLQFQEQDAVVQVADDVKGAGAAHGGGEEEERVVLDGLAADDAREVGGALLGEEGRGGQAEQLPHRSAQVGIGVVAGLLHHQRRRLEGQQDAVGLDLPRDVDGLARAVVEVDGGAEGQIADGPRRSVSHLPDPRPASPSGWRRSRRRRAPPPDGRSRWPRSARPPRRRPSRSCRCARRSRTGS